MFEQIIKLNQSKEIELRKQNLDLITEIAILKEQKAIHCEMIKILFEVIKKFGSKCNETAKEREELALAFNQLVINLMPKEEGVEYINEITTNTKPMYKEVVITESVLNGIGDVEKLKRLIDEHDKFVFV